MDLYRSLLARALFPAFEAARGRPTVPLLRYLRETERWSAGALRDLQVGLLRRLIRHAYGHTAYYREILDERDLRPEDFGSVHDLAKLPLLDRATLRATLETRTAEGPPEVAIVKTTSGSSGQPVTVRYNAESRHWRDAIRWRGYGWGGYEIGMRALHYWGVAPVSTSTWWKKQKANVDHALKRDYYIDCTPRSEAALGKVVEDIKRLRPHVMVAYAAGAAALAKFINTKGLRAWEPIPVLTGAEGLLAHDRAAIEQGIGPAFDTYGCRETMLIGSECELHDGLHTSMENLIVEILVREDDGSMRAARPGELGEIAVTDLHNLACPMIRYLNGDLAVARADDRCACGRGLVKIGSVQGRVTETLQDAAGNPVGGLVFNVLFSMIGHVARDFRVTQRLDRSVVISIVPYVGDRLPEREERILFEHATKYLPGVPVTVDIVNEIPLTAAGKRRVVVVERA
ncbi:MAG: phenylacetate--CoA ligase family protein [Deltaproteobacteria bacterium]|nr:phenylacetate--CoA ligase family protein [Deltaproteobacteria bacterium]MDQ3297645.1 hypothetical protein [Myxococcota bacterium]